MVHKSKKMTWKVCLFSSLLAIVVFAFVIMVYANNASTLKIRFASSVESELATSKEIIETSLNEKLFYAEFLNLIIHEMLQQNQEIDYDQITSFSSFILSRDTSFRNITIAQDGIVNYMYPLLGSESVIGLNLLTQEHRKDFVLKAIEEKRSITQGPLVAVQGGLAIFNRSPIFIHDEFWGIVSVVLDFDIFLDKLPIGFETEEYQYALMVKKVDGVEDFVYDPFDIIDKTNMIKEIQLQGINWQLAIYPKAGWNKGISVLYPLLFVGLLLSGFVYYFAFAFLSRYYINEQNSQFDAMTGLKNRLQFELLLNHGPEETRKGAMVVLDIDNFKAINDSFGHLVGDEAIVMLSKKLKEAVRDDDSVYRIGGDEFAIMIYGVYKSTELKQLVHRILDNTQFTLEANQFKIDITVSMGVAKFPEHGKDLKEIFRAADDLLYQSKAKGKNQVTMK